jgi:GNAT superfamily N-acetyltransferase
MKNSSLSFTSSKIKDIVDIYQFNDDMAKKLLKYLPMSMYDTDTIDLKKKGLISTLFYSLKDGDELIGIIEGHLFLQPGDNIIYIRQLTIHPNHRRKGYGSQAVKLFIKCICETVKACNPSHLINLYLPKRVELITENEEEAELFWKSQGFIQIESEKTESPKQKRFSLTLTI